MGFLPALIQQLWFPKACQVLPLRAAPLVCLTPARRVPLESKKEVLLRAPPRDALQLVRDGLSERPSPSSPACGVCGCGSGSNSWARGEPSIPGQVRPGRGALSCLFFHSFIAGPAAAPNCPPRWIRLGFLFYGRETNDSRGTMSNLPKASQPASDGSHIRDHPVLRPSTLQLACLPRQVRAQS